MLKLLIQEVLVLLNNYSRILVLLKIILVFLNFGQIWSVMFADARRRAAIVLPATYDGTTNNNEGKHL